MHSADPIPQQSSETCAALDTLIAGRYVNETGICAKNSLCTAITCVNPDWGEAINLMVTFSPCDDPISVSIWAVVTPAGAQPTAMDQISTENRAISFPAPFSNLGVYIMLDQTDTGVNFGVSSITLCSFITKTPYPTIAIISLSGFTTMNSLWVGCLISIICH